jgi:ribosomal-protein-alanine N-acetyltransferase
MKLPFIVGEQIYLRPLLREDLNERYLGWLNDPEANHFLESGRFPYTMDQLEDYYQGVTGSGSAVMMAVVEKSSDDHIGNVKLEPINWVHRTAVFGILIGEKAAWGKGYGTEATRLTVAYAFEKLNLRKVSLGVVATNTPAIKVYEKVGFQVEGVKREEYFVGGQYVDALWMAILRDDRASTGE